MAAWGTGPFDNDAAADWSGEVEDASDEERLDLIRAALEAAAQEEEYLDNEAACVAVAAAAIVAMHRPDGPQVDSAYAPDFLSDGPVLVLADEFTSMAAQALDRVTGEESEWRDLREETDDPAAAFTALQPIRDALAD